MARGKVQLKKIENPVHRQVTFCKRRTGLFKKAKELSVLCDAEIGVFIHSSQGKIFELSTKGDMQGLIESYMKSTRPELIQADQAVENQSMHAKREINMLNQEIDILQKGLRYMFGVETGTMTLDELQVLEKNLEIWIYHIRSAKMDIMFQEIQLLRNKEGILKAANEYLKDKIEENIGAFDSVPSMTDSSYPLTIQNNVFQF
uniref:MADS68 n=1 Tax=Hippophae rhamnoides TaxID=193516 RepID=A0AAU7LJG7_9ROSA